MPWSVSDIPSQQNKLAVVTGANAGLGFHTARHLARKGSSVILACRSEEKAQQAIARIQQEAPEATLSFVPLDLTRLSSVAACAQQIREQFPPIDYLVNNAGIMMPGEFSHTADDFELQFGVNYLGHFALTGQLLEHIKDVEGSRIISLGSIAHLVGWINFDNLNAEKRYSRVGAYGRSKLACIIFAYELQRRLKAQEKRIKSLAAHPGLATTELQRHSPFLKRFTPLMAHSSEDGSMPTLRALTDPDAKGGHYFGPSGLLNLRGKPVRNWSKPLSHNKEVAKKLWQRSQELTGVQYL